MARVLVAMSGGVDSSVAAYLLLKEGHECIGATMRLAPEHVASRCNSRVCCSLDDVEDARAVARMLGIEHYAFDYTQEFENAVVTPFIDEYLRGRTPSPCIVCNRHIKFERLVRQALDLGCDYIASGHYARLEYNPATCRVRMRTPADTDKDQTYMLHSLTQVQLLRMMLPLGGLLKRDVRALARELGLVTAEKPESQDICFIPDGDYVGFIERRRSQNCVEGDILDLEGTIIGKHRGALAFTVGQRKGLGVAAKEPLYVVSKDMDANTVTVGPLSSVMAQSCLVENWNWIEEPSTEPLRVEAKTTYRHRVEPALLEVASAEDVLRAAATSRKSGGKDSRQGCERDKLGGGKDYGDNKPLIKLTFDTPQRAMAPGQAAVAYCGDVVVGGGTIRSIID